MWLYFIMMIGVVSHALPTQSPPRGDLISREIREVTFQKVKLQNETKGMDELDRDIFIMDIWKKPLSLLQKKYPKVSPEKLKKAKKFLEDFKK